MKVDNAIVGSLKLLLEQMVAARRQYRKGFLATKVRQDRRSVDGEEVADRQTQCDLDVARGRPTEWHQAEQVVHEDEQE